MSNDMNSEALDVMRMVYSWNTGKEKAQYPVMFMHMFINIDFV